jgi:hypothetical protein
MRLAASEGGTLRVIGPVSYVLWAAISITLAIAVTGLTPENVTRLLVIGFLLLQLALRAKLVKALPALTPRTRFVVFGTALAAVVEGLHMISVPVFPSLRVGPGTTLAQGLFRYAVDLAFTVPAYLVIFTVIFAFVDRWRYSTWAYAILMGFAQAVGDGGLFLFATNPGLLAFLPYPMTNYHAINVIPYLAVRDGLAPKQPAGAGAYLALPAVVATYLVLGGTIKAVGRWLGPGSS